MNQAVALEQVESAVVTDRVGDPGADEVAEDAGGDDPEELQFAFGDREAGEEHDRLAGDRDAGGLQGHQQEDGGDAG
jgi:hypothetical protein